MRPFNHLMAFLFLAAGAAGCGSKDPAGPQPPPGVIQNPVRPNPEAIRRRKLILIDSRAGGAPSPLEDKR